MTEIEGFIKLDWCGNYFRYLELKNKGLKKDAREVLNLFFKDFKNKDKTSRREFICKLNEFSYERDDLGTLIPFDLFNYLFLPEIKEWIEEEPNNSTAYKWSYELTLLRKALHLNPFDQVILKLYGQMLMFKIGQNQHDIGIRSIYHGDPKADIQEIDLYLRYISNIEDKLQRNRFYDAFMEMKAAAIGYIQSI